MYDLDLDLVRRHAETSVSIAIHIHISATAFRRSIMNEFFQPSKRNAFLNSKSLRTLQSRTNSIPTPLSPRSVSTINLEITTSHEAARVADAEHGRTPVLLGHTQLAQHVLRRPVAPAFRVLLEKRFHHRRCNVTRGDGVDTDAVGAPLGSKVAAKLEDGGF